MRFKSISVKSYFPNVTPNIKQWMFMNNHQKSLADLERALNKHPDAEVKCIERLRIPHAHTSAVCKAIVAIIEAFNGRKIIVLVEAEISELGHKARPEDIVAWIEFAGVFVIEVKSHDIKGIRSFENNVPQVIYQTYQEADVDLLDQPKDFAYKLKAEIEKTFDGTAHEPPPLYFAGWLPNVSPEDVARLSATIAPDKVWLCDMLEREVFLARLPKMKNLTKATKAERTSLEIFCNIFGTTSGLRRSSSPRATQPSSLGNLIDRKNLKLKKLTKEQEDLAFNPNLVRGPKVIRGVAGSGKTIVLANAIADLLISAKAKASIPQLFNDDKNDMLQILVLCFNRTLAPGIDELIKNCFDSRKPNSAWSFPSNCLKVVSIDRYAYHLAPEVYDVKDVTKTVDGLIKTGISDKNKYNHVFIDEGQDVDLAWYPLIRELTTDNPELGRSIIVFYDEAQNLYGMTMPGVGGAPPWKEHLGAVPHNRGLHTVMRVGHRNTNEILSFSFNMLLGSFAEENPQMVQFSGISEFEKEVIPDDPSIKHPNAGKKCVEKIDDRQYCVNFAAQNGPRPVVHAFFTEEDMLNELVREIDRLIDPKRGDVNPKDVLIMVPEKAHISIIVSALADRNIKTHTLIKLVGAPSQKDPRDQLFFMDGKVTVSTINSAKGYTAHVCHLAFVHSLEGDSPKKERRQKSRAQLHVACTRSSLTLDLWGTRSLLMDEAEKALAAIR